MSQRGVFAVSRAVFDHDCFANEPYTEREAWVWLIGAVVWKDKTVRIGKFVASLKRGQGAFSLRFLAEKWQWSKSRVDRFLDRLKNRDMIGTKTDTGISIITINNYTEYQRVSLPDRDSSGTQTGTAAGQQRDKEEDIKNITIDDDDGRPTPLTAPLVSEEAILISSEVAAICGHDPAFLPPAWLGSAMRVQVWLSQWDRETILAACSEAMAKKRDGPPSSINYFEKAIAQFAARLAAPLPEIKISQAETVHVVRPGKSGIMAAIDGHIEQFRRAEDADRGANENPTRLLSDGRR
jgi:hypothetical protein